LIIDPVGKYIIVSLRKLTTLCRKNKSNIARRNGIVGGRNHSLAPGVQYAPKNF